MSQVMPNGERHSTRTITKTPKQTQLDEEDNQSDEAEEYTTKKQQQRQTTAHEKASRAEEQKRIKTLKAQAQAESESAVGAVQMMSDVGDLPGLDNDDPNYDLIRKIAHLTGRNYAGQGLTTEELQETLDDPMACTTPGVGDLHQANDQPPFAAFYPGRPRISTKAQVHFSFIMSLMAIIKFLKEYEHEENANGYQRAYGERYREKIYDIGRAAYEEHMPVQEDPLPPAKGTWGEDMQMDMDLV
ncbi:hypothetical protein RSOL_086620, partial [Rhizoctonia solani AG-3 Rhs1AP]